MKMAISTVHTVYSEEEELGATAMTKGKASLAQDQGLLQSGTAASKDRLCGANDETHASNSMRRPVDLAKTRPQELELAKLSGRSAWASILFLTNAT
jgi:hypothetical protein